MGRAVLLYMEPPVLHTDLKLRRFLGSSSIRGCEFAMASMAPTTGAETSSTSQYTYTASTASYFPTPFHLQQTPPVSYIGAAAPPPIQSVQLPVYPAPSSVYSLPQYQQAIFFPFLPFQLIMNLHFVASFLICQWKFQDS